MINFPTIIKFNVNIYLFYIIFYVIISIVGDNMKKTFKICLFIFLFFVVSVFKVNAETTVNYSCDYNFDGIKFRIRVNNLPQQYVKDAERIRSMSNVKSYVIPFYWPSDGSG